MRWLLAVLALAWSSPAFACVTEACPEPVRTFGAGAVVPGNLVYFVVLQDAALTLEHEDGSPIAASTRMLGSDRVFAPERAIEPGRVRLRWSWRCESQDLTGEYTFSVGAEVTPPLAGVQPELVRGEHGASEREGYFTVGYLTGYDHLFDVQFAVDDTPAQLARGGSFTVRSPCDRAADTASICGGPTEFELGPHTVHARGHVIGTEIAIDDSLDITTSCAHASVPPRECGAPTCGGPAVRLLPDGISIPGNLAYFKLLREGATLSLSTQEGAPIASSVRTIARDLVFAPEAPIPAGTSVRLRWSYDCEGMPYAGELLFSVRDAKPLQVVPGALLRQGEYTGEHEGETFAIATVALQTNDDVPHLYETRFFVDGDKLVPKDRFQPETTGAMYGPCEREPRGPDACGVWHELPYGRNTVVARSHVIGADSDPPPMTGPFQLPCDQLSLDADGGVDASRPTKSDAAEAGVRAARRADGCQLATGEPSGLWLALALLLRRKRQ